MEKVRGERDGNYLMEILKALIISLIFSLVIVIIMAFAIKLFNIPTSAIVVINQITKGVSILIAALLSFRLPNNGWIRGLIFGILYILLTYIVFSLLDDGFVFGLSLLNDIAIGSISGLASGIIAVNLRKH